MTSPSTTLANKPSRSLRNGLILVAVCAAIGAVVWYAVQASQAPDDDSLTWDVERTDLRITVTERGTLKSQKTVNGVCEVEGYDNKIIFIVEEGSTVKKGDVVVRIDSSEIDKEIAEEKLEVQQAKGVVETKKQEIEVTRNEGESAIAEAQLELTLAVLDLEKYEKGDYLVELNDLQGKIALAEVELEKANVALASTRTLVKKGFREPDQIRTAEQTVESAKFSLERDKRTLDVLKKYDYKRKQTEFKAKAEEAARKLKRAKSSAEANSKKSENEHIGAIAELKLQDADLEEAKLQKTRCEIRATQGGVVAYANEEWWSESRRIREGGTVYEQQVVFFIPDMSLMELEVKVHESEVKRVAAGQKAIIRVEAFANKSFTGTVKSVAQLSKSEGYFGGGVKEYPTVIVLDETPSVPLRPGMTAEVEILLDNLTNVVAIPVQAIAEHRRKHFVYVRNPDGFKSHEVEIGQTNNRLIEIKTGLEAGGVVALDARSRAAEEFGDDDGMQDSDELLELQAQSDKEKADASIEAGEETAEETNDQPDEATDGRPNDGGLGDDGPNEGETTETKPTAADETDDADQIKKVIDSNSESVGSSGPTEAEASGAAKADPESNADAGIESVP